MAEAIMDEEEKAREMINSRLEQEQHEKLSLQRQKEELERQM